MSRCCCWKVYAGYTKVSLRIGVICLTEIESDTYEEEGTVLHTKRISVFV